MENRRFVGLLYKKTPATGEPHSVELLQIIPIALVPDEMDCVGASAHPTVWFVLRSLGAIRSLGASPHTPMRLLLATLCFACSSATR